MAVVIVPNAEVLTPGAGGFVLNPAPTVPLYQTTPRLGPNPMLYETISPTMTITVQGTGTCFAPPLPELITSVTLIPGQGVGGTGAGCSITKLIDLAGEQGISVTDIPQYLMQGGFLEPSMVYGTVFGPPAPTMALVAPLKGFYGEKYFYDAEYIYASYYKNTPTFDPIGVDPKMVAPTARNRLNLASMLYGKKELPFESIPPGLTQIGQEHFPTGMGTPILLENFTPQTEASVLTVGSDYLASLVPEVSSWVKWRPSFIELMTYNYTLVVTHTCPPFVTYFPGTMVVENNWTPAANRLAYYIELQNGFLDFDYENAETAE